MLYWHLDLASLLAPNAIAIYRALLYQNPPEQCPLTSGLRVAIHKLIVSTSAKRARRSWPWCRWSMLYSWLLFAWCVLFAPKVRITCYKLVSIRKSANAERAYHQKTARMMQKLPFDGCNSILSINSLTEEATYGTGLHRFSRASKSSCILPVLAQSASTAGVSHTGLFAFGHDLMIKVAEIRAKAGLNGWMALGDPTFQP